MSAEQRLTADQRIAPDQRSRVAAPMQATERRLVWAWAWTRVRPYVGWVLAAAGTVALFVADLDGPAGAAGAAAGAAVATAGPGTFVALPAGTSYHRPDCGLVTGKSNAATATPDDISARGLRPCRVCDPGPVR